MEGRWSEREGRRNETVSTRNRGGQRPLILRRPCNASKPTLEASCTVTPKQTVRKTGPWIPIVFAMSQKREVAKTEHIQKKAAERQTIASCGLWETQ